MPTNPEVEYPSSSMQLTLADCREAALAPSIILLLGESGSGKDYLARYIHNHSKQASGPFFAINVARFTPELVESELFGHERGAFTGAIGRKRGLLELAESGTLLLNEIGELSLPPQAKLLTFLDNRKFTRVGGEKEITVNARLIAATNRDLGKEVATKRFRQDLYYRINVIAVEVPPLRERLDDIPILVQEIMAKLRGTLQLTLVPSIDTAAMELLQSYSWPGNVRELRNLLERVLVRSRGRTIDVEAILLHGKLKSEGKDEPSLQGTDLSRTNSHLDLTDDQFRRMIKETFQNEPTPVEAVRVVLGCRRKDASQRVKKVGCNPGKAGRLSQAKKERMINDLRQWLHRNRIL